MDIKFTEKYKGGKERQNSLADIVEYSTESDRDRGALEQVREVARASIKFNAIVVEILHRRGVLNDVEVQEIVDRISGGVVADKPFEIIHD